MSANTPYRDLAPEVPFLPGQRVCLNPEGPSYSGYNRSQARGDAGYIVNISGIDEIVKNWRRRSPSDRASYYAKVKWDNGHINTYCFGDLLPVDAPMQPIINILFTNGETLQGPEEEIFQKADEYVFYEGWTVRNMTRIDEEYQKKLLEQLA